jgi:ABC-type transporter Mla subunit MlaD
MQSKSSLDIKVGAFVLSIFFLSIVLIIYIGIKKELFAEKVHYIITSTTGEKLERGIPVKISGFKIGRVSNIYIHDINQIEIEIELLKKHMVWLREGSKVTLSEEFPIGNAYINIIPGPKDKPLLLPNSTIVLYRSEDFASTVQEEAKPLIKEIKATVSNLRKITEQILAPDGAFQQTLSHMQTFSKTIVDSEGLLSMITKDPEPARRIRSILKKSDLLIANLYEISRTAADEVDKIGELQHNANVLISEVESFIGTLTEISRKLEPTVSNMNAITDEVRKATKDLVRLRSEGEYTLRLGNELLQRISEMWPISQGQKPAPENDYPMP